MMTTGSVSLTAGSSAAPRAVHARHLDVEEHQVGRLALDERHASGPLDASCTS
jgi:hypothetical protein